MSSCIFEDSDLHLLMQYRKKNSLTLSFAVCCSLPFLFSFPTMRWTFSCLALALWPSLATASCPPKLDVTLRPILIQAAAPKLEGELILPQAIPKNETILIHPITMAGIPSAQYTNDSLRAEDDNGDLPLTIFDGTAEGQPSRFWVATRASVGPTTIRFTATPREVELDTKIGPLFDFRANGNGLLGSMWSILPVPPSSTVEYQITLSWDLAQAPANTRPIWTWGEGAEPATVFGTTGKILYTFFAVGDISSFPSLSSTQDVEASNVEFGMYWLEEPSFNATTTARFIQEYYTFSAEFWQDDGSQPYRVFVRHNENVGAGGTALPRSFMFGWHNKNSTDEENLKFLLAHEITHNWPTMSGASAAVSRFGEGMADYYSLRLLWRARLIDMDRFASETNKRVESYYRNPTVNMSDTEAYDIAWESAAAQRISYGRGMIDFLNLDAQLRSQSNGTKSFDELALQMLTGCRSDISSCNNDAWLDILEEHLGPESLVSYETVASGNPVIEPISGSLGPCFDVIQTSTSPIVYQWVKKDVVDEVDCMI